MDRLDPAAPIPYQVAEWVLAAGQTTHLLLVAGLRNPTVRRRYVAVRELLAEHNRREVYEHLLDLLGCAGLPAARVAHHLAALAAALPAEAQLRRFPGRSPARPVAVGCRARRGRSRKRR